MPRELHILEPALSRESGHFPTLLRAIVDAARGRFDRIRIYAHHRVDVRIDGAEVVPTFRRRIRRFTVMRLCARLLRRDVTVFFNTASNSDFVGLRRALFFAPRPRARVVVFRHAHYPSPKGERWMSAVARKFPEVVIACPTPACGADMRRVGFANVVEIPYPHVELPVEDPAPGDARVRVVLPGVPRVDKGLPEVAALAEHLARRNAEIPLVVQASKDHWGEDQPGVGVVLERLRRSPYKHLELVGDRPDPKDFAALFRHAIVLVPYERDLFKDRISGITLDALRFGCPVITTSGTWMARQVEPFGAGELLDTRSPEELERAIRRILADLPRYREGARRAGAMIAREQAASPLAQLLAGSIPLAEPKPAPAPAPGITPSC